MSNYEDAIGRAQAMIDWAYKTTTDSKQVNAVVGLIRVQLELASMFEPQPEVEVEGTDVSAELLVAALADGSLESKISYAIANAELEQPSRIAHIAVGVVQGVLLGVVPAAGWPARWKPVAERTVNEADAGFTDADLGGVPEMAEPGRAYACGLINDEGVMCRYPRHHQDWTNPASHSWNPPEPFRQKLCNVAPAGNDKGLFCGFLKGHAGDHSWAGMVDSSRSRDSEPVSWPLCNVRSTGGLICNFEAGHTSGHSWVMR